MCLAFRLSSVRFALLAAGLALGAAAASASQNLTIPIGTCSPGNLLSLQNDLKLTNGAVQKPGRNPPGGRTLYFCDVPIDDLAASPSWNRFEFQYIDRNASGNGNLRARLMRRAINSSVATEVVRATSVPSASLRTASVALPAALNTAAYDYFVIVELTTPSAAVDAVAVRLVTR